MARRLWPTLAQRDIYPIIHKDILVRGQGLEATSTVVLILIGYALLLLALAAWRFRVD